jgi:hypothetical protein
MVKLSASTLYEYAYANGLRKTSQRLVTRNGTMFGFPLLLQINDVLLITLSLQESVLITPTVKEVKLSPTKNTLMQVIPLLSSVVVAVYQQSTPRVKPAPMDQLLPTRVLKNTQKSFRKQLN